MLSSLDEKLSDLVGHLEFHDKKISVKLNYNFALDQNYQEINYNEVGASINLNQIKLIFYYLQEDKHIGNKEYFKTKGRFMNRNENRIII